MQKLDLCRGMLDPKTWEMIEWPAGHPPLVVVVVDTEAEFDWAGSDRARRCGVSSVKSQLQMQRICRTIRGPTYYVLTTP